MRCRNISDCVYTDFNNFIVDLILINMVSIKGLPVDYSTHPPFYMPEITV